MPEGRGFTAIFDKQARMNRGRMENLLGLGGVVGMVIAANWPASRTQAKLIRWLQMVLAFGLLLMSTRLWGAQIEGVAAWEVALAFGGLVASGAWALGVIFVAPVRVTLQRRWLFYDANSAVHNTALILVCGALAVIYATYVLGGGSRAMSEGAQVHVFDALLMLVLWLVFSVAGVGLLLRRDWRNTLMRLGVRWPTQDDWLYGVGAGLVMFGVLIGYAIAVQLYMLLTGQELIPASQQAFAEEVARNFNNYGLAFLLAFCAAVGEEVAIRGALQPVFGALFTSAVFMLLHQQYFYGPGMVLIFGISLGLAWLRHKHSTTAAILAHFVYNFIQLALLVWVSTNSAV
jgi:uncharacterized protein